MEVIVRLPRLQDYERVSKIMDQVQQLHVEWRPDVYKPASPLITMDMFEAILKDENWYVAEADGVVVGVLELLKRHVESPAQVMKDVLFISTMAVDEKYRGKGIGHLFFEKVKRLKQEKGYDTIELQVNAKNRLAYEMYRKYGFTEKSINMELKESALG
ncbi:GNAT family N-acetyltransferase [Faecalibacterium prausnitzii]|uniref:GNAT family N-acetyltransferase n=1 Tax=Faecalibacterium prausnitzii TaxID=853 RepID=A0A2A7AM79_9FIRM|nr:GNAT family N-acetyltransferase [Faecalibacterium prausnitzii]PDX80206.1 GNAT family N-acetyltransferase [Faecalibacterium prausnitzii]